MKGEKLKLISTCIIVAFSGTILPGLCTPTSCGMLCQVYKPVAPPPSISALARLMSCGASCAYLGLNSYKIMSTVSCSLLPARAKGFVSDQPAAAAQC